MSREHEYKDKLIQAVQDGVLDGVEVVEKLLSYIEEDTIADIVDEEGWDIGIRSFEDYGNEE